MQRARFTIGLAVVAATFGMARGADEEYDLRGPGPKKGQVYVSKGTFTLKDAEGVYKFPQQTVNAKATTVTTVAEEVEVLAVEKRQVVKYKSKVTRHRLESELDSMGRAIPFERTFDLEGKTITGERDKDAKWKHTLVGDKPSDTLTKLLAMRTGVETDDTHYPAEKVKVGHAWRVEGPALTRYLGSGFTDVKGRANQKFAKVEDVDGESCAVIETNGTLKGKSIDNDGKPTMDAALEIKVTVWKSLKTGLEVKSSLSGSLNMTGKIKAGDQEGDATVEGKIIAESSLKLK